MLAKLKLYAANTANGYKALIPLHEFGCDYSLRMIDLVKGEQFDPEFLALSPIGRIPTIAGTSDNESFSIYGSEAIAIFLAEHYQRFLPSALTERAEVLQMTSLITSDLALPLAVQFQVDVLVEGDYPKVVSHFVEQARRIITALDTILQQQPWLGGKEYSIADMLAYPSIAISALRVPGLLEDLDSITSWQQRVSERPAVKAAMAVSLSQ